MRHVFRFVCVCALGMVSLVACSNADGEGCVPGSEGCECNMGQCLSGLVCLSNLCVDPGTGGNGGTGGDGGTGDACTNTGDQAVYADLDFTDNDGNMKKGSDAAAAIARDCVFGSRDSVPPIDPMDPGCDVEAGAVVGCAIANNCTEEDVSPLRTCVEDCQKTVIEEITGSTLTDACSACYGDSVACSLALCTRSGCNNATSTSCICCQCGFGCTPNFDVCSGLPPTGECEQCN